MICGKDFDGGNLIYIKPKLKESPGRMERIIGLDTEAYTDGTPFIICTSLHDILLPKDIPEVFFEPQYVNANFVVYNLKYDSGALLYHLPLESLQELWRIGKTNFEGYHYEYIPKKLLKIQCEKDSIWFWDIAQFYKSSLDSAAFTYLQENKLSVRTKAFTREYVKRYFHSIARYCINDAVLTAKLGNYLVDKLGEFGIDAKKLYSCASISFKYFCEHTKVVTAWRYWKNHKRLLMYACDAYEGGKFEVTARGYFSNAYEYDLTSAYPYEIANLVDISHAHVEYSPKYQSGAVYGYLRCFIHNPLGKHLPCGIKRRDEVRYYPAGDYFLTITKGEYDYLVQIGVQVEIVDGVWLFVSRRTYPYRRAIQALFKIKDTYKGKDKMLYNTTKIVMNSFYGKMAQCVEKIADGKIVLGRGWNPMYAAEVTAGTRIKVSRIQNLMGDACFAVHTDSVIVDSPIPDTFIYKGKIGEFEYVDKGDGVIIACGMYQVASRCAFKGFVSYPQDTWIKILSRFPHHRYIPYWTLHVESWIESMAKNHGKESVNVFCKVRKLIDLDCDVKRVWPFPARSNELLGRMDFSASKLVMESNPPKLWVKKDIDN